MTELNDKNDEKVGEVMMLVNIQTALGYLPGRDGLLELIRKILAGMPSKSTPTKEIHAYLDPLFREVRNLDMKADNIWPRLFNYETADKSHLYWHQYRTLFAEYKAAARERLAYFLGYYPEEHHSLPAEMEMRMFLIDGFTPITRYPSPNDMRAMMIVKYREVYFSQGEAAADALPLITEWPRDEEILRQKA